MMIVECDSSSVLIGHLLSFVAGMVVMYFFNVVIIKLSERNERVMRENIERYLETRTKKNNKR